MASRTRWTARVGIAALAVGVAAPTAWAATWTPTPNADKSTGVASGQYSWNYGSSFARLDNGDVAMAYTSDKGTTKSKQSTYARVGSVSGGDVSWTKPVRSSKAAQITDRTSLATSGNNIHTVYVTQTSYGRYDPAKPRTAFIRSRVGGSWNKQVKLSSGKGRVDYPIVAASGSNVYVAYTNSNSGQILMRRSTNDGSSFNSTKLGKTTRDLGGGEGFEAWGITCASGSNVALAWLKGDGTIKLSVSKDSGSSYSTKTINSNNAGGNDEGWAACDATGDRIGVTWNENDGVYYAEYNTGSNSFTTARKNIYPFSGSAYAASYAGAPSLTGASTVGLAVPLCVQDGCDYESKQTRIDLKWLESSNNGSTFGSTESISNSSVAGKYMNDSPSVLWYDSNTRMVLYNGWTANYTNYRLYLSVGAS